MDAGRMANAPNRLTARVEIPAACGGRKPNKVKQWQSYVAATPARRCAGVGSEANSGSADSTAHGDLQSRTSSSPFPKGG